VDALVRLCYSGKYDMDEMLRLINHEGGLKAYLPSSRLPDVREAWRNGDPATRRMVEAMAYQTAREIGARASTLNDRLRRAEAIVLTGPWALFEEFVEMIRERVSWIAPTSVHVWKSELFMLSVAAIETFKGRHKILLYSNRGDETA
jgi:butyrate kinase